jgi:broad specificity phosphatase PhoE
MLNETKIVPVAVRSRQKEGFHAKRSRLFRPWILGAAMLIYLVRHAEAGLRTQWNGDDGTRPLTDIGKRQAAGLVEVLAPASFDVIASSPSWRCQQTVAPTAAKLSLNVKVDERLEAGSPDAAKALVRDLQRSATNAVLCSHGEVIPLILSELLCEDGVDLEASPPCGKGSIWILQGTPHGFLNASYVAPFDGLSSASRAFRVGARNFSNATLVKPISAERT